MPKVYTKTNAFTLYSEEWDFDKFPNDIVIINLGINDIVYAMNLNMKNIFRNILIF